MPLPIATIGLSLAAAGLKIFGHHSEVLEFAAHPIDIAAGHLGAEKILELAERLRNWYAGSGRIENQNLERAVTRAAILTDWFCLLDALPPQPGALGPARLLRERFRKWLPENAPQGLLSQAEESAIRPAIEACERRLMELEEVAFVSNGTLNAGRIDPLRLILPERGTKWGAKLAGEALEDIQREHANLPDRVQTIFRERWFPYLCLAFQDRIKTDPRVSAIFLTMQIATGFVNVEEAIHEFREENREFSNEILAQLAELLREIRRTSRRPATTPVDPYASVRAPVQNYVDRLELQDRLRELVLGTDQTVALTALQGMGGIGKTELARKLCHDPNVREAFSDGIVWLEIGRESSRTVLDRMKEVAEKLNDDAAGYTLTNCETRYRSLLAGKAVLVVLDDVWSEDDVKPFIPNWPRCRLLFTTRNVSIASGIGAADCTADVLNGEQARAALAKYAALEPDRLPPESADIITKCGSLPQGLAVVGSALRGKPKKRWADILEKLRHTQVVKVLAPTAVSVDELGIQNPDARERYLQLAVLLEDMVAQEPVLKTLWGVDARTMRDTVDELENRSLARREENGIRIHRLQMDYVRSVYLHREALPLIHEALRLSLHVVERDGMQFASQMVGRLMAYEAREGVRDFVESIRSGAPRPWLHPLHAVLIQAGGPCVRSLKGHTLLVFAVAMSADGRRAVSASADRTLRVWEVDTGRELRVLTGHSDSVDCVAVTSDGRCAVSGSSDRTLKMWELDTGRALCTSASPYSGGVSDVAVSADGRRVVFACESRLLSARGEEWNSSEKKWERADNRPLQVWEIDKNELRALEGHSAPFTGVALSEDGRRAIAASADGALTIWDVESGRKVRSLEGHSVPFRVALSADGRRAIAASADGSLKIWDVDTSREVQALKSSSNGSTDAAVSAAGQWAVSSELTQSGSMSLGVWDLNTGRAVHIPTAGDIVSHVAISADGRRVVSCGYNNLALRVWDIDASRKLLPDMDRRYIWAVAASADGRRAVSVSGIGTLTIWDVSACREGRTLVGNATFLAQGVALSADGRRAVSGSDNMLRIWDVDTGLDYTLKGHSFWITGVALSADGRRAVSAGRDCKLKIWELDTGCELGTLEGHSDVPHSVAMSADGRCAVSASEDGTVKIWNVDTRHALHTLEGHCGLSSGVAMSADGRRAVSAAGDCTLRVWNAETGVELCALGGPSEGVKGMVRGVALSADGFRAVSACLDGTVKVWDLETGTALATFTSDNAATCCALCASGTILVGDDRAGVHFLRLELPDDDQ